MEGIDDITHVTVTVPDPSVIQKIHYEDWNESPNWDDDTHEESYVNIERLAMLVEDVELVSELGKFLDSL